MANILGKQLLFRNRSIVFYKQFKTNFISERIICSSSSFLVINCKFFDKQFNQYSRHLPIRDSYGEKFRFYSTKESDKDKDKDKEIEADVIDNKNLSLFKKFKLMYKQYWYVLLPVHMITSGIWFGGFYFVVSSGVDVASILSSWHVSDVIINPLRDSKMGAIALTFALYKLATPLRYAVTLGGTTVAINYLRKLGYIKPVPSKEKIKAMYQEKKEDFLEGMKVLKPDKLKQLQKTEIEGVTKKQSKKRI